MDALESLTKKQEIERLLFDYAYYLDRNDTERLVDLFTADCEVVYGPTYGANGRDEYARTLEGVGTYFAATSHHVSNISIDFTSTNEASVRSVVYAWHKYNRERPDGVLYGQYHDKIVHVGGSWKFATRKLLVAGTENYHVKDNNLIGRL